MPGDRRDAGLIRITAEDAASSHVDDLLRRQDSLRGQRGITANRRRKWYYRNWFVFMLAGLFGALVAWAIIEPHFHDLPYYQGKIEKIDTGALRWPALPGGVQITAELHVNGEMIYLMSVSRRIEAGRAKGGVDPGSLAVGQEVGLYLDRHEGVSGESVQIPSIAIFLDPAPPPRSEPMPPLRQVKAAQMVFSLLLFPGVAALVGLAIGAADGIVCRLWRRVLLAGVVGLLVGFLGGFIFQFVAALIYLPLNHLALQQQSGGLGHLTALGFLTQVTGRALAWCLAGAAMGLGQGVALRSGRLFLYGLLGGAIGGLLGGLLFDPIDLLLLGPDKPSAALSRAIGVGVIGATVGAMIGVVELLARDAWLQMLEGPLAGKEFLIFKDLLYVGASPRSDIYLFNDKGVAPRHAILRAVADAYEIEAADPGYPLLLNGRSVERSRLRHGDQLTLGKTVFAFQRRHAD
jgi:hypothetical protein